MPDCCDQGQPEAPAEEFKICSPKELAAANPLQEQTVLEVAANVQRFLALNFAPGEPSVLNLPGIPAPIVEKVFALFQAAGWQISQGPQDGTYLFRNGLPPVKKLLLPQTLSPVAAAAGQRAGN